MPNLKLYVDCETYAAIEAQCPKLLPLLSDVI